MSNGIEVNGDGNSLLFSTDTSNLFYQGKATYSTVYGPEIVDYLDSQLWGILYNRPLSVFYEYTIDLPASTATILPFVRNPVDKRVSILNVTKISLTTWRILIAACTNPNNSSPVISSTTYIPEVYVFSNYIDSSVNTGHGINAYDSSGGVVFTSNETPLLMKAFYSGNLPYSNLSQIRESGGNLYYIGNGPNRYTKQITWFDPLNTVPALTKPAIAFSYGQTTVGTATSKYVYEANAVFDGVNKKLGIEWTLLAIDYFLTAPNAQSTVSPFFAFVIDGADYD